MSKLASHQLLNQLNNHFLENEINTNAHFIVGVSGGKDSMALLHLLKQKVEKIHAVHVNYKQRADESEADQALVENFCKSLDINLSVYEAPTFDGGNFQNNAREFRYLCFKKIAIINNYHNYYICTAHHQNDQVETILHAVLEGKSISLFKGMKVLNDCYFKPMLTVCSNEIDAYIDEHYIEWRLDKSNLDTKYKRNFLRNMVIPTVERKYHNVQNNLLKLSTASTAFNLAINHIRKSIFVNDHVFQLEKWQEIDEKLQTVILADWLHNSLHLHNLTDKTVLQLVSYLNTVVKEGWEYNFASDENNSEKWILNFSNGYIFALMKSDFICYEYYNNLSNKFCDIPVSTNQSFRINFNLENCILDKSSLTELWFQYPVDISELTFRSVKNGDRFKPIGLKGKSKKVKDILAENGIPSFLRNFAILIFAKSEALALLFPRTNHISQIIKNIGLIAEPAKVVNPSLQTFKISDLPK